MMYNECKLAWICICATLSIVHTIPYADTNKFVHEFNLEYEYQSSGVVKFKTVYDYYNLTFIKCSALSSYPATNGIIVLESDLQPCRQFQCNVVLISKDSGEQNLDMKITTGITAVSPLRVLSVEPGSNLISIMLSYSRIDCIISVYVLIDNSRAILYTNRNLTEKLIISDLSPCVKYNVVVLLNYQFNQYVLFDDHIKTYEVSYHPVENIQYNLQTSLLTWSPAIIVGCDAIYQITVQSFIDGVKNTLLVVDSKKQELQLGFLPKCLQYLVLVEPKGYQGLSGMAEIDIGYENKELYAPGPVKHLTVDLINESMLSIKWSRPTLNPECVSEYSVRVNNVSITTKSPEHIVSNYIRTEIYNIAVCTIAKPLLKNCIKYVAKPSNIESISVQNVTKIEISTNYNGKITTINWNSASLREHGIKYYAVRIFDTSGSEIYRQNVTTTMISLSDLGQCEEYYFNIEAVPAQNWTNKIESRLTFKSKPQIPVAPQTLTLGARTSRSLTMSTSYQNPNDKCEIEIYRFACSTGSQVVFVDSGERFATISNLRRDAAYYCYAMVMNEIGWSEWSTEKKFKTDTANEYQLVELYTKQILSNSIFLAWATTINSTFDLHITKIVSLDTVPTDCKSEGYDRVYRINSEFNRGYKFENLQPNTNYSIQVETGVGLQRYSTQIYVTTHPDIAHQVNNLHITSLTNETVSIAWDVPCILNGRIKHFLVTITATNETYIDSPVLYRNIPPSQFHYTETSIKPSHSYNISVAVKLYGFAGPLNESTIEFISQAELNNNRLILYIAIIAAVMVVLIISSGLFYYLRYLPSEETCEVEDTVYIDLPRYSSGIKPANSEIVRKEFQMVCGIDLNHLSKTVPQNQVTKNRCPDIIPYDINRVVLKPNQYCFTDYINASYIDGYNDVKQYIATQGPNHETVYDFWHMVIQEKCDKIIMLTKLVENGCEQCVQYYPKLTKTLEFDDLTVKNVDETNFGNFIKRSLYIMQGKMKRHIVHYQYTAWSDRDGPENPLCLIEFVEVSGIQNNEWANPIVVHSSAGAGRTGTFIALDILFQNCRSNNKVSVSQTVRKLRSQRCGMVQTIAQYEFLYAAIKSYYLTRVYKRNEWR